MTPRSQSPLTELVLCLGAAAFRLRGPQWSGPIALRSALVGARNMIEGDREAFAFFGLLASRMRRFLQADGHSCDISP